MLILTYRPNPGLIPNFDRWAENESRRVYTGESAMTDAEEKHMSILQAMHNRVRKSYEKTCDVEGHQWLDTSDGGPESGHMSGYCLRCGHGFHHILY